MKHRNEPESQGSKSVADIERLMHAHAGNEPAFSGLQQRLNAIPDQYPRQPASRLLSQLLATLWPKDVVASWRVGRLAFMALLPMALGISLGQVLPENSDALMVSTETEWYYLAFGDVSNDISASDLAEMEAGAETGAGGSGAGERTP